LPQSFLLSAKAVTLGILDIAEMSDDEAYALFKAIRFADNGGEPQCPHCDCKACYEYASRPLFKCKACEKQFTVTSGMEFHSRKLRIKQILVAVKLFVDGVNGEAALHLRRNLHISYKTSFVLAHKLRDAMASLQAESILTGTVEIDGCFTGGHVRPENMAADRGNTHVERAIKRRCIVTFRERRPGGRSRSFVFKGEKDAHDAIRNVIHPSADVITDQADTWGKLYLAFNSHETVNHTLGHVIDGIHINWVESYHSRIRRGERGVYVSINHKHAQNYADEFSWREDHRRVDNGQQYRKVLGRSITMKKSRWVGYWQKRPSATAPLAA
jgi:transposase-like protein